MAKRTSLSRSKPRSLAAGYQPLPGVPDELLAADGAIRPIWAPFLDYFSRLDQAELMGRFARGDEYLRDAGVYFRQYGQKGAVDRAWPLSHVPVILHESEWQTVTAALSQRANLLESLAADLYGANTLISNGFLPASIVASNPEWLRPLVGIQPANGHFLHFVAFDIGRGPGGQWWVLEDRVHAPSGAGFALENRVATARVFADYYADAHVHRMAGFFRQFRDALNAMRGGEDNGMAILSPGPMTDTYYEHAYIARYLGLPLLEGEDLTVDDSRVMVRSVSGNRPVTVLWRRLDSNFADPLELDGASRLGAPGLVEAVRQGNLSFVNALGTGALEAKALFAFLPGICRAMTGESLAMPNVATWWCGHEAERNYVKTNADKMVIGPAVPRGRAANGELARSFGVDALPGDAGFALNERNGRHFVGQEQVTLSTTPVWEDGKLVPRPLSLRVFLARTADGWTALPGGFARIGRSNDPKAVAMQSGGSVADVWVVSDHPVKAETMLPLPTAPYARPRQGTLPGRAADNLFWLGRYVERAEGTMRLLRAYFIRLAEAGEAPSPLLDYVHDYIEDLEIETDEAVPATLRSMFYSAMNSAGKVRDRFSVDGWMALNDLADSAGKIAKTSTLGDDSARAMGVLLRKITGFSGLVHDNMYRFTGWRFLTIGRSLERAMGMASLLARLTDKEAPDGALDFVVEVGDSTLSHRRRYTVRTTRPSVIDLLALDTMNPRSILYQLNELRDQVDLLPGAMVHGEMSDLVRAVLRVHTDVAVHTPDNFSTDDLLDCYNGIAGLSELLTDVYLKSSMLYEIKLVTKCTYGRTAAGRQLLRLMPADWPEGQRLIAGSIDIRPAPAERSDRYDFFGNRATEVTFSKAIEEVEFVVRARVDRFAQPSTLDLSPKLARLAAEIAAVQSLDPMSPHHYVDASPLVRPSQPIADYVRKLVDPGGTTLEAVKAVNAALHRDMRYDGEATTVDTPLEEAFAKRRGVCQDFTHIMIACLREVGIPAGYVSGFLRTEPPKGKPRLEGADAMHAWVQAWCGLEAGWVEFDPTNKMMAGPDHIVAARGRDYSDVAPVRGMLRTSGAQDISQAVDVLPVG